MSNAQVKGAIRQFEDRALGWKLAGAGGGGYLALVVRQSLAGAVPIKIRRANQ
jgi:hypothetical protein